MNKLLLSFVFLAFSYSLASGYSLHKNYTGTSFFSNWDFFTGNDPTHGYVNYVSEDVARQNKLISATNTMVTIRSDSTNVASGRGRDSVRITSKDYFYNNQNYLFINHLKHMPAGCGTWPAWWLVGPNWPNYGEIDIIEGVNVDVQDQTTLHTNDGCDMRSENPGSFTGAWGKGSNGQNSTNCYVNAPNQYSNQGCGIIANSYQSYGANFNRNGGGYFVAEWTNDYIRFFFFTDYDAPHDISSSNPNPNNWGKPYAYFELGSNCPASHFNNLQMVINLTFCGDWAGSVFSTDCPGKGSCNSYVQYNPHDFSEAYWDIHYITVYTAGR